MRDAATVVLGRDGPDAGALEVFMLRRTLDAKFVGGAYVFPGGAVDEADRHTDLEALCDGRTDAEASALLGVGSGGLAYWVAAIRECFEEAGVLLATTGDGELVSLADPETAERFKAHRAEVAAGRRRLVEVCEEEGLRLAAGAIHYLSHWITPEGPPRRFDTRFFVTAFPPEQVALHDDAETIANLWVSPAAALERHRAGELDMILPTIKNLEALARHATAAELVAAVAAREHEPVPAILPRVTTDAAGTKVLLPGEPGYDEAAESVAIPPGGPLPGQPGGPRRD